MAGLIWLWQWAPIFPTQSGGGGGSGTIKNWRDLPWGQRAPVYDLSYKPDYMMDLCIHAVAMGGI